MYEPQLDSLNHRVTAGKYTCTTAGGITTAIIGYASVRTRESVNRILQPGILFYFWRRLRVVIYPYFRRDLQELLCFYGYVVRRKTQAIHEYLYRRRSTETVQTDHLTL